MASLASCWRLLVTTLSPEGFAMTTDIEFPHHEPTQNLLAQLRDRGSGWVILQNLESNGHYSVTLRHRDNLGMYPNSKILKTFEELPEQ
jgi:hypothetical protein